MNLHKTPVVRDARPDDLGHLVAIHDARYAGTPEEGFFVDRGDYSDLRSYLESPARRCFVAECDGEILGFMQVNRVVEHFDDLVGATTAARCCGTPAHWHVDNVAVSRGAAKRGLGRGFYRHLVATTLASSLSAYVVVAPMPNAASLAFHAKLGFADCGEFSRSAYCGVADYRSRLFVNPHPLDLLAGAEARPAAPAADALLCVA